MIKPAYSVSFLLSINIAVWQNVLYFPNDPRIFNTSAAIIINIIISIIISINIINVCWVLNPVSLTWTLLGSQSPFGSPSPFTLVHASKTVRPPAAKLRQIQFVTNFISSEDQLSH